MAAALEKALSSQFKARLVIDCINPYGDGHSSQRILDILLNTQVANELLIKKLTY
ncbi:MAG: hypothetical protein AAGG51_27745 [Cyanobacteria bacterium P01_G01_bin.54]